MTTWPREAAPSAGRDLLHRKRNSARVAQRTRGCRHGDLSCADWSAVGIAANASSRHRQGQQDQDKRHVRCEATRPQLSPHDQERQEREQHRQDPEDIERRHAGRSRLRRHLAARSRRDHQGDRLLRCDRRRQSLRIESRHRTARQGTRRSERDRVREAVGAWRQREGEGGRTACFHRLGSRCCREREVYAGTVERHRLCRASDAADVIRDSQRSRPSGASGARRERDIDNASSTGAGNACTIGARRAGSHGEVTGIRA